MHFVKNFGCIIDQFLITTEFYNTNSQNFTKFAYFDPNVDLVYIKQLKYIMSHILRAHIKHIPQLYNMTSTADCNAYSPDAKIYFKYTKSTTKYFITGLKYISRMLPY